jgi:ADP-heptose:LPS heptosyltransferase
MHLIDQQLNLMIRGRFEEAWKLAEELEALDPDDSKSKFNRGWFLINQGKLQEGFKCLEHGRALKVYGSGKINTTKPIWDQSDLKGKTVILNMECGFGDQMIYARFATEIWKRGGKCIMCCEKSLHPLFLRIPGVKECITLDEVSRTYHDFWIPGFSASWLFGHEFDNLPNDPYIFAKDESVDLWKTMLNTKKLKVGIRWSGSPLFEHQQFRIFPAEKLINLHKDFPHIQFYSLQRDTDIKELPEGIADLQHLIISWEDTAACIANLDLVITSCTSIAHLASAMGKPTWVIVPILPYHVWAYGGDHSPWYQKTTKVFRQTVFGDWTNTFQKVSDELKERFPQKTKKQKAEKVDV